MKFVDYLKISKMIFKCLIKVSSIISGVGLIFFFVQDTVPVIIFGVGFFMTVISTILYIISSTLFDIAMYTRYL